MPEWSRISRSHVLTAIAEHDDLGDREFLRRYGFGREHAHVLWHGGRDYDCKAIVGAAYLHATGIALGTREFSGGRDGAAGVLTGLGFDVAVDEEEAAAQEMKQAARPAPAPPAPPAPTTGSGDAGTPPRPAARTTARSTARSTAAPRPARRTARTEPPAPKICPRCFMALPATGVCDFCD